MASTYSTNLKIELQATGENAGTWGTITNTNLGTALEQAIVGYGNPSYASDANLTLTYTDTNAAQAARALVLNVTSAVSLTGTRELVVPTIQKQYIVQNNTTGSQSITVKTSAGTGITVPNGRKAHLYVNGTDVIQMFDFVDINGGTIDGTTQATGTINGPIAAGGTWTAAATWTLPALTLGGTVTSNNQSFSGTIANLGTVTTADINGGTIDGTTIGGSSAAAATVTTLTATADSSFTSTGALLISKGTTAQQPSPSVTGMLRYNTTNNQFEGYSGSSPSWKSVGGAAVSNDTSTASDLYPAFLNQTTGTAENVYTSNAKLLYKPSTGELKASAPVASNGIFVNSTTVAASYTIASGTNGFSVGPITVNSGVTLTVASGQRHVVI